MASSSIRFLFQNIKQVQHHTFSQLKMERKRHKHFLFNTALFSVENGEATS